MGVREGIRAVMNDSAVEADWECIDSHRLDGSGHAMRAALPEGLDGSHFGSGDAGMLAAIEVTSRQLTRPTVSARLSERYPVQAEHWWQYIGRVGVVALMAASPVTSASDRKYLLAFVEVWAETIFADPTARLRTGLVTFADLVRADERGAAVALHAAGGQGTIARFIDCRTGEQDPPSLGEVRSPRPITMNWGNAAQLRSLIALIGERGPMPWDVRAVRELADRTGLGHAAAALILAGYLGTGTMHDIGDHLDAGQRKVLGHKLAELRDAAATLAGYARDDERGPAYVTTVFADVLPADPAELWQPDGMVRVAARLADAWNERHRRRPAIPESTLAAALKIRKQLTDEGNRSPSVTQLLKFVAAPDSVRALTAEPKVWMERYESEWRGVWSVGHLVTDDGGLFGAYGEFNSLWPKLVRAGRWAYTALPAGDPVRDGVPRLMELLRTQLRRPGLLIKLGWADASALTPTRQETITGARADPVEFIYDDGLVVARRGGGQGYWDLAVRPAEYGHDERTGQLLAIMAQSQLGDLSGFEWIFGPECDAMVARITDPDMPSGGFEVDPRLSAPALVAEVGRTLGLDEDAAVLYLQLATSLFPTDREIRRWNGWKPARHAAAEAVLVTKALVVRDKRARAGRSVFLPGAWLDKPGIENYKWQLHGLHARQDGEQISDVDVPRISLPTQFARSWEHLQSVRADADGGTPERVRATVVQGWEKVTQIPLDHRGRLLRVLPSGGYERSSDSGRVLAALVLTSRQLTCPVASAKLAKSYAAGSECWGEFIGRIGAVALRSLSPFTRDEEREYLLAFLGTWAETIFADRAAPLRTGVVESETLVVADERGAAVAIGDPHYDTRKRPFLDCRNGIEEPPALGAAEELTTVHMAWGDAEQLRSLLALIARRGPVPWDPSAADELARRTGLSVPAATLILSGYLGIASRHSNAGRMMDPVQRKTLPYKLSRFELAGGELADFSPLEHRGYVADLLAHALPADPVELWQPDGMWQMAGRIADAWVARHGRRVALSEETLLAVASEGTGPNHSSAGPAKLCAMLAAPDQIAALTAVFDTQLERTENPWRREGTFYAITDVQSDLLREFMGNWVGLIELCRWAAAHLPPGDPVRAGIPRALELLRIQLRRPGFLLALGETLDESVTALSITNPASAASEGTYDDGLILAKAIGSGPDWSLFFRPEHYALDPRTPSLRTIARHCLFHLDNLDWLFSAECDQLVADLTP